MTPRQNFAFFYTLTSFFSESFTYLPYGPTRSGQRRLKEQRKVGRRRRREEEGRQKGEKLRNYSGICTKMLRVVISIWREHKWLYFVYTFLSFWDLLKDKNVLPLFMGGKKAVLKMSSMIFWIKSKFSISWFLHLLLLLVCLCILSYLYPCTSSYSLSRTSPPFTSSC